MFPQQFMDLSRAKRSVVATVQDKLPRQARTTQYTCLPSGAGHKERSRKRGDLTIEDNKEQLSKIACIRHHRAAAECVDPSWDELVKDRPPLAPL